jgi:hypothetical protein
MVCELLGPMPILKMSNTLMRSMRGKYEAKRGLAGPSPDGEGMGIAIFAKGGKRHKKSLAGITQARRFLRKTKSNFHSFLSVSARFDA